MLRLAFDFIITWRETRTRPNAYIHQAVWVEYKGWWLWKRIKAIRQTISSDNPHVEIKYSEYIKFSSS